jgi:two-component system, sensor histidine kinase and response regulator
VKDQTVSDKSAVHNIDSAVENNQLIMDQWLEMFAFLVHDLESPLASMKYLLRLLDKGQLDLSNPLHSQIVASSRIAVERAESILYDSMAVAKSRQLGLQVNLEHLPLAPIIRDAVSMVYSTADENQVKLEIIEPIAPFPMKIDSNLLKRSLDNLIFNAIRHTPQGGNVVIYTDFNSGNVNIHIKDSGNGLGDIDPEELFARYGQINLRSQGKHRGVGLGLYFCKLATDAMHGTVSAGNHPEGGAVFTICLQR